MEALLQIPTLALLVMEGIKTLVRAIKKTPDYDFPLAFYVILLPVLEILMQPVMVWLGLMEQASVTFSLQTILLALIQALVSVFLYEGGMKPLKEYAVRMRK